VNDSSQHHPSKGRIYMIPEQSESLCPATCLYKTSECHRCYTDMQCIASSHCEPRTSGTLLNETLCQSIWLNTHENEACVTKLYISVTIKGVRTRVSEFTGVVAWYVEITQTRDVVCKLHFNTGSSCLCMYILYWLNTDFLSPRLRTAYNPLYLGSGSTSRTATCAYYYTY
jgi:hypothetical protein